MPSPARHPQGTPVGGRFAPMRTAAADPAAALTDDRGEDGTEFDVAYADASRYAAEEERVRAALTTLQIAHVAQLALEDGAGREDRVLIQQGDDGALTVLEIEPADEDADIVPAAPAWSQGMTRVDLDLAQQGGIIAECAGPPVHGRRRTYAAVIGAALDKEAELLGDAASDPHAFTTRFDRAEAEQTAARDARVRAAAHVAVCEAEVNVPGARGLVYSPDAWHPSLVGLRDADGHLLVSEEAERYRRNGLDLLDGTSEADLRAAGVVRETAYGLDISFDAVRRLRGVADNPNQPSLIDMDLADLGWAQAS